MFVCYSKIKVVWCVISSKTLGKCTLLNKNVYAFTHSAKELFLIENSWCYQDNNTQKNKPSRAESLYIKMHITSILNDLEFFIPLNSPGP